MSSPRRRGAQIGNLNALKHGFYTRRFTKRDLIGVESTDAKSLTEEIAMIRLFTRRLIESLDPQAGPDELAGALHILCVVLATLTRAMKTQHWLAENNSDTEYSLNRAIQEFWDEFEAKEQLALDDPSSASIADGPSASSPRLASLIDH